jgi:hypothetical protein
VVWCDVSEDCVGYGERLADAGSELPFQRVSRYSKSPMRVYQCFFLECGIVIVAVQPKKGCS